VTGLGVIVAVAAVVLLPSGVSAAPVFGDGFESGDLSQWTTAVRFGVQTATVRTGTYASEASSTGQSSFAWRSLPETPDVSTTTWFRVSQRSTAAWLVALRKSDGGAILLVGVDSGGRLTAKNVVTSALYRSSTVVPSGAWQQLQVDASIGSAGSFQVTLGGSPVAELSRSDNLGTALIGRFAIGDPNSSRSYRIEFDDVAVATSATGSGGDPTVVGRWDAPFDIGVVGVHAVLLHTGKVLLFYRTETTTHTAQLFDPATGQLTDVSPPVALQYNMFCSAHDVGPNGEVFVTGGLQWGSPTIGYGTDQTAFFDPDTNTWSAGPTMALPRWYPSIASLANGDSLIVSGDREPGVKNGLVERIDPGTRKLTTEPASATKPMRSYPRLFVLPDGRMIRAGQDKATLFFDPGTSTWSGGPAMSQARIRGSFVLLPGLDRIVAIGGAAAETSATTATTEVLDLSAASPKWQPSGSMHEPRRNFNAVLLPDGSVLAVGGNRATTQYDDPVLSAELYDPSTGSWKVMASQAAPRSYHSTAVLLPDGRVLSAGQTRGTQQTTAEIYSPPYLFAGPRPTITQAPQVVGYGASFGVGTPDAATVDDVVLIRPGSVTHGVSFDQRSVDLSFSVGANSLDVTAPASGNFAPPGWYLLFLVRNGVPSVASWVHLS
jgi:hypothetical protein